ncbi:MAG: SecD/SecF family protein translocase subunit [Firmicutes bacterium]|nr:SecD/SecF family protein translocase subunit [Bacillota bacterium]MDY5531848.1 SecD/SecF family protein translocase subunit [Pumilibacteraceae bacterium]
MKKTSSIIKLIVVGVALAICMILATCSFRIPGTDYNYNSFASVIDLGLDLKGGVYAVFEASSEDTTDFATKLEATKSRLTEMLTNRGYTEAVVVTEGENRIRVSIPSKDDAAGLFAIIGKPAGIEFVIDDTDDVVLTGDDVVSATGAYGNTGTSSGTGAYVSLELTAAGVSKFSEATGNNVGKTMSIYLVYDGVRESSPITTATINSQITGNPIITMGGSATETDAKNLATQINSGTFQLTLSVVDTGTQSATLGEQALKMSIIGGLIGLLLIFVFLIVRYRLIGVSSVLSLLIYAVVNLFVLGTFPFVQLSLPGIAGVLLGIGMAVDGNIIMAERIREEYKSGKSVQASFHAGIKKSRAAIIDGNVTTMIAAIILILVGTGTVYGFGITLAISIVLSVLCSMFVFGFIAKQFVNLFGYGDAHPGALGLKRAPEAAENAGENKTEPAAATEEEGNR